MASVFQKAVAQELGNQPTFLRYKGSILIVIAGVGSILAQLAASPDFQDSTLALGFTVASTLIAMLVNRFTKDGVTPSMAAKLEQAALVAFENRPSLSGVTVDAPVVEAPTLPVYAMPEAEDPHTSAEGARVAALEALTDVAAQQQAVEASRFLADTRPGQHRAEG